MYLADAIAKANVSVRVLATLCGLSKTAMSRITKYGEYPSRRRVDDVRAAITSALQRHGVFDPIEFPVVSRRDVRVAAETLPRTIQTESLREEELMQMPREVLAHFGLRRDPWINDIEEDSDVFACKAHAGILQALRDAVEERAMVALVAPSGSGKTTTWDTVEAEMAGRDEFVICRPAMKYKEVINPDHLAQSLIYGLLGDDVRLPHSSEQRGRMLTRALQSLRTGSVDRRAVLLIDDAHYCNQRVLRQLKTFYEEKIGRYRLLSIILIGLPELKPKLECFSEIGNRIRLIEMPPVPVEEYLRFKLARVGSSPEKIFDAAGLAAFLDRFRAPRRPALGLPLVINATCIRAMAKLWNNGAEPGERISREIIDQLPGGTARTQRVA